MSNASNYTAPDKINLSRPENAVEKPLTAEEISAQIARIEAGIKAGEYTRSITVVRNERSGKVYLTSAGDTLESAVNGLSLAVYAPIVERCWIAARSPWRGGAMRALVADIQAAVKAAQHPRLEPVKDKLPVWARMYCEAGSEPIIVRIVKLLVILSAHKAFNPDQTVKGGISIRDKAPRTVKSWDGVGIG